MAVITDAGRDSLVQVYGHAQMLVSSLDSLRDMVSSSQDALITLNSEKLNETMKVLTLFASILLPMTVIAGIYGMNFQNMPKLLWEYGYFIALGSMAAAAGMAHAIDGPLPTFVRRPRGRVFHQGRTLDRCAVVAAVVAATGASGAASP